jgi:hypothetical protein
MSAQLENELASLARSVYGDNTVEFLVGALSSVTTESQIQALVTSLTQTAVTKLKKEQNETQIYRSAIPEMS